MWLLLAILPLAAASTPPDFFAEHLSKNLDHSVDPCDNFYRHVCPNGVVTVTERTEQLLLNITHFEQEKRARESFVRSLKDLENMSSGIVASMCTDESSKDLEEHCSNVRKVLNPETFSHHFNIIALHKSFEAENLYQLIHGSEEKLRQFFDDLLLMMKTEVKTTVAADIEALIERMGNKSVLLHKRLHYIEAKSTELVNNFGIFTHIMKELSDKYYSDYSYDLSHKAFHDIIEMLVITLRIIDKFDTFGLNAGAGTRDGDEWNLRYSINVAHMLLQIQNKAMQFGAFNLLLGHEISHVFVGEDIIKLNLSSTFHKKSECVAKKFKQSCELFNEVADGMKCLSSFNQTLEDDSADIHGMRLAYRAFLDKFRNTKDMIGLGMLNRNNVIEFTNEQLFFYGAGIIFCNTPHGHYVNPVTGTVDDHSGWLFRTNTVVKEVSGFATAFNCKQGQRMYQAKEEQCVLWGNVPVF